MHSPGILMSGEPGSSTKLFTVEEANAMLPLVRAITSDVVRLSREIVERRQRLAVLSAGRKLTEGDPYGDELLAGERDLHQQIARLQEHLDELTALGVECKGGPEGLVDFPSWMDGRVVYLCWQYNEPEISHWHELDAGFAGRQSLGAATCSRDSAAS